VTSPKMRLDQALVQRGFASSRARAQALIVRGLVTIDGAAASKPSQTVSETAAIAVAHDEASRYVSRAALKLVHGLDHFGIQVAGCHALDLGASTGGFTQLLLERGAAHVDAVDVGHGQLHPSIAGDARVTVIEGLNARALTLDHLTGAPDRIVCDVCFISLTLALPPALSIAADGAVLVALIKPQFEVGKSGIGGGGIVRDEALKAETCHRIRTFLEADMGWPVIGVTPSPVRGSDGNEEFLIAARRPAG
jgi:23S rRNA (cytidine1920-2'-O)/16S rRNA (cytidine1409-2'-O)-methyltransferase